MGENGSCPPEAPAVAGCAALLPAVQKHLGTWSTHPILATLAQANAWNSKATCPGKGDHDVSWGRADPGSNLLSAMETLDPLFSLSPPQEVATMGITLKKRLGEAVFNF